MARSNTSSEMAWHEKKRQKMLVSGGFLVFIMGLALYLGYPLPVVLMLLGIILMFKGLLVKLKKW